MTRDKSNIKPERPEALGDAVNQLLIIAFGKIRTPDRALKQHIADHRDLIVALHKYDMAGRMTGTMNDIEIDIGDRYLIAGVFQAA